MKITIQTRHYLYTSDGAPVASVFKDRDGQPYEPVPAVWICGQCSFLHTDYEPDSEEEADYFASSVESIVKDSAQEAFLGLQIEGVL